MTTTMANIRGIPYQVTIQYYNCTHMDAEGQSDCNEPIPASSWEEGDPPTPLGAWEMGLCYHHYVERLRAIVAVRRNYRAQAERTRQIRLRLKARAMRRTKAER